MGGLIRLPSPHPGQLAVRQQAGRHNRLAAGRRWFKTTLVMAILVENAVQGKRLMWCSPTVDQNRIAWDEAKHAAGGIADFRASEMIANFPNAGQIIFRSLNDPDNARGWTLHGAAIDECADVKEEAYYEVVLPMLMTTGGFDWLLGTPKGRNWFWRECIKAREDEEARFWNAPTLGVEITDEGLIRKPHPLENPLIPFREVVRMHSQMSEKTFRQEILAEFVEDGGAVFRGVDAVIRKGDTQPTPRYEGTFVAGLDWGREHDYTDLRIWDAHTRNEVDWVRITKVNFDYQRELVMGKCRAWAVSSVLAEQNSIGKPNIEALQRSGLPVRGFTTTNQTKAQAVEALALAIETKTCSLPDVPENDELKAYQQEKLPSGLIRYSAPPGMYDDSVMARMLANTACIREPVLYDVGESYY